MRTATLPFMLGLACFAATASAQSPGPTPQSAQEPAPSPQAQAGADTVLDAGLDEIAAHFIQPIPRERLETMALAALLEKLDPYSHFFEPAEMDMFRSELEGSFAGVGLNLDYHDPSGYPRVAYLLRGGIVDQADLRRGDLLLAIDGKDLKDKGWAQVATLLRGRAGTPVTLRLRRAGVAEPITVQTTRVQIDTPSVRAWRRDAQDRPDWWLDRERRIGYLRLASVVADTPGGVAGALRELQRGGARGLVLDLRDCAGGLLDGAVDTADLFVDHGRLLSIHQRDADRHFDAKRGGDTRLRLAILINKSTISSCEVLAGALADNHRGTLFGERSYGKGRMQVIYTLGDGRGGMVMSTGTFQRPNGRTIDKHDVPEGSPDVGIAPDVEVPMSEDQHKAWLEHAERTTGLLLLTPQELAALAAPPDPVLDAARAWLGR